MAKKVTPIEELTFVRSLNATKENGEKTSFAAQPYRLGMYVIINNNSTLQLSLTHKKYKSWVKGSIKELEKNGFKVETTESKYINFLKENEIKDYILQ